MSAPREAAPLRAGVDIGGTFTDVVIEAGPQRWSLKTPTTHAAPEAGVLDGLARGLALAGRPLADVELLVHGTTLATNAVIERKGARTGLLTTAGFRDVVEMGDEGRFDQYDLRALKPEPLVPRHLRFEAVERIRHDGSVVRPLDEASVLAAAEGLRRAEVEAVAVCFLHAYADGAHEARARELLAGALPGVPVSVSHEVSPEMREHPRASTTCANAYLQPVVGPYLLRLERMLAERGYAGRLMLMLSSGGLTTVQTASRFPVRLLESGPAGGAVFAGDLARGLGLDKVLSLDVGGTTAKFCLIDGGEARRSPTFEVARTYRFKKGSGLPIRIPVVDLVEIGAGGGSIAGVDAVGRVAVGPRSAGSEPGPACYGRGGTDATVTDCDLLLGRLDAASFAGGTLPLDRAAAGAALSAAVAAPTGLSLQPAAVAVAETISETMAAAARVHAAELGADLTGRTLIAFGGAAPLHAARFAEKLGIPHVVVPPGAGVGSAIGFLRAPVAFEIVRTIPAAIGADALPRVEETLAAMEAEAAAVMRQAGPGGEVRLRRAVRMRYVGQGHDLDVAFEGSAAEAGFGARLTGLFEAEYARVYGRRLAGAAVETTAWSVRAERPAGRAAAPLEAAAPPHAPGQGAAREVFDVTALALQSWPEHARDTLAPGVEADGPAVITEAETTTLVPPGWRWRVDASGALHLHRQEPAR